MVLTTIEKNRREIEQTKKKIEKEFSVISSKLEMGADEALRQENQELRKEIDNKQYEINRLNETITKHLVKIDNQKLVIKRLLKLIQDTIPRVYARAVEIIKDVFTPEQEKERTR